MRPAAPTCLFETMAADARGEVPLWADHLDRLQRSMARLQLPWAPPPELRTQARTLLLAGGHAPGVLRLTCTLPAAGGGPGFTLASRPLPAVPRPCRLLPSVQLRPTTAPAADLKAEPRDFYAAVLAEAEAGGADDGIVLGADGAVLETAIANLWLVFADAWVTPPLDGRVLPGVARARLLSRLPQLGIRVRQAPCTLADLHRAGQILLSNAVRGLYAAQLLGSSPAAVVNTDKHLEQLWGRCGQCSSC